MPRATLQEMLSSIIRVVWTVLLGSATLVAAAIAALTFVGVTPNETVQAIRVFTEVAVEFNASLDVGELADLIEVLEEVEPDDLRAFLRRNIPGE